MELSSSLDDAIGGRGRLFLLSGEPGIGKTRLAEEIAIEAASRGIRAVWGRCWEGGGAPAYWPWIQVVRACLADADAEQRSAILGSEATPLVVQDIAQLLPELHAAHAQPFKQPGTQPSDPEQARFQLFESVATLLRNVARIAPLMIVIDDLQDADQPSLLMQRFIARQTKDARILIVGTYRDTEVRQSQELSKLIGDLNREGHSIPIIGLSQAEVGEFIERRLGHTADEKLIRRLYHVTDGNPLFVDGVVRLLAAEGTLDQASSDAVGIKIPDGVRESIRRRLVKLSEETSLTLSTASIIGNDFEARLVAQVSEIATEQIIERMQEAIRAGIVIGGATGNLRYRFSHPLIREALYGDLAAKRRIDLHSQIGSVIEEVHKDDLKPHLAALAHHFREGGVVDKAIHYSTLAGEAAYKTFAYEAANPSWQAALRLMEEHNLEPQNQARLLERIATLMYVTDTSDPKGMEYLDRALNIYEKSGQTRRAALVHSRMGAALAMRSAISNPPGAMEHYRKAEAILGKGADSRSKANLYAGMAMTALQLVLREEGLTWSRAAMDVCERIGNEEIWVNAACLHALHLFNDGRLARALTLVDEASNRADRLVDAASVYGAAWNSASLRVTLLDPRDAPFWLLRELAKPRLANVTAPRRILLGHLLTAYVVAGDLAQAKRVWEEADLSSSFNAISWHFAMGKFERAEISATRELELSRRAGSRDQEGVSATLLAGVRQILGDLAGAERFGRIAIEKAKGEVPGELKTGLLLAGIYAEMGNPERAHQHLTRCREIIGNGEDWRGLVGAVALAEAVVASAEGKYEDADRQFEKAVEVSRRYHVAFEEAKALHYWGRSLNASGRHGRANEKLDAAVKIYQRCCAGERWIGRVEADRPRSAPTRMLAKFGEGDEREAVFRQEGDYWTIAYLNRAFRLRDMRGLHYIAYLLGHANERFHVRDLAAIVGGDGTSAAAAELRTHPDRGDAAPILDHKAKADYRARLSELRSELDEAERMNDGGRAEGIRQELEFLNDELSAAVGLAGRDRKMSDQSERARLRIGRVIRSALSAIREHDPSLGHHFTTCIHTGYYCAYTPDPRQQLSWKL